MRQDYPDKIKEDDWRALISMVLNDLIEPLFKELREDTTSVYDDIDEIFNLKDRMTAFRDANDEDGALLDDIQLIPFEGNLMIGVKLRMKN